MSKPDLRVVAVESIQANPVALREVERDGEQYQALVHDVGKRGVLLPITVIEKADEATGENYFQIVDGLHRFSAASDNGLPEVPVNVLSLSEQEVIETQVVSNLVKVDTKPVEYTKALQRMMNLNPTMTVDDLADRISQSKTFVMQRLSLLKLDPAIQSRVDSGDVKLANAYALAKLPREHQYEWLDSAISQQPNEFVPAVNNRCNELKTAAREGRQAGERTFEAVPRLRKLVELKSEYDSPEFGPAVTAQLGLTTAAQGFAAAIAWVVQMDAASVETAKAKFDQQNKAREDEKKRRAAVREERKRREAAEKAAKARAESGLSDEELEAALAQQQQAEVVAA